MSTSSQGAHAETEAESGEAPGSNRTSGPGAPDSLPVLAEEARVVRSEVVSGGVAPARELATLPAVQAAAVAAGGFVAGAAVVGLVARRQRRSQALALARGRRAGRRLARGGRRSGSGAGELVQIVGSRSLLLDVHLLGARD
jgi:dienelactone hydrolase